MAKKKKKPIICPATDDLDGLTDKQKAALLDDLMCQLDDLDLDDELGTEGWRHRFGYED